MARRTDKGSLKYVQSLRSLPEDVIILLHGGGNFGDLYPKHQILREEVVKAFPNNKIVYLPQTVHFKDQQALNDSAKIIRKHKNLTIFCRDLNSEKLLKEKFCDNVIMCPDMAHSLWQIFPRQNKTQVARDTLWMLRKDIEKTDLSGLSDAPESSMYEDWEDICSNKDRFIMRALVKAERINNIAGRYIIPTSQLWGNYTDQLVKRVNEYFLSHKIVVTSRMHGHILCCLLDMPTKLLDNSYGKNSTYYDAWTHTVPNCELVKV